MKYLIVANDDWFDFEKYLLEMKNTIFWFQKPSSIAPGDSVYFYLSGKTKAVKYEFDVVFTNLKLDLDSVFWKKYLNKPKHDKKSNCTNFCKLKFKRKIQNLNLTNKSSLNLNGKILGSLMSSRKLSPYSADFLDSIN